MIWKVCGLHSVSSEEVYSILAADKQAKAPVSGRVDLSDAFPAEDDIEISNFLELYEEDIFNYLVQLSKYQLNQWNSSWKEQSSRECCPKALHNPVHVEKTSNEVRDKVLYEKLNDIFENLPKKFSVSAYEIKELGITTEGTLNEVIDIVFEKAVETPDFSIPYANLCKLLSLLKVPCSGQKGLFVDIKDLLFTKCQKELGKNEVKQLCKEGKSKQIQAYEAGEEEQVQKIGEEKQKRRQLGTARFMGWMFKLDILTETMMHQVINSLLLQAGEVATKCACLLVLAIGSELDRDKVESYISDLKRIIDSQYANTKLGTILQQISDLKMNDWVPSGEEKRNKIIDKILSECQEEKEKHIKMPGQMECGVNLSDVNEQQEGHLNPQGPVEVKQYNRQFLLNLQNHPKSLRGPDDLPDLNRLRKKMAPVPKQSAALIASTVTSNANFPGVKKVRKKDTSIIGGQLRDSLVKSGEEKEAKDMKESPVEEAPKTQITLKYNYKKDQWSPLNCEGKKQYDREFLLNLQSHPLALKKPPNLPNLEVIKDRATLHKPNEKKSRMTSATKYLPRARYTDPFESIFAWTKALGRPKMASVPQQSAAPVASTVTSNAEDSGVKKVQQNDTFIIDDQCSPLNSEGKKQYDREFLLNLESHPLAMKKPSNLPNLDMIKDKATLHKPNENNSRMASATKYLPRANYTDPFELAFARTKAPGRPYQRSNFAALSQLSMSSSQTPSPLASKSGNSYNQTAGVFFGKMSRMPVQAGSKKMGNYKGLPIIDPVTGRDFREDITSEQSSHGAKDGTLSYQRSNFAAPHQFSMPSSQAPLYHIAASNNWNSYNQTAAVFFGQMSHMPVKAGSKKTGNYKGPPIIDPVTGRDVIEDITNESSSQGAKDRTLSDVGSEDLAMIFAAEVAQAIADEEKQNKKLEFTTKHIAKPELKKQITPEELKQNLQRLLRDHESNEEIFNWLERHIEGEMSPLTYRALVTVIYESVITSAEANYELNVGKLKERMCILARYMDVNRNLELQAIFALQYLMNKLRHPKGILLQIFDLAYNEDFLSNDAFKQWEHCDDPAEQEGRGVAIHSVSSFFAWLKEGEDDESAEGV